MGILFKIILLKPFRRGHDVLLIVAGLLVWPPPGLARPPGRLCWLSPGGGGQSGTSLTSCLRRAASAASLERRSVTSRSTMCLGWGQQRSFGMLLPARDNDRTISF